MKHCTKFSKTGLKGVQNSKSFTTSRASMTVATPTVRAWVGTLEISPSKNLAFATIVSFANVFILVLDASDEPGSLKAICPSGPIPKREISKSKHFKIYANDQFILIKTINLTMKKNSKDAYI